MMPCNNFQYLEIVEFEVVEDDNPYLPDIPENLDEEIHGAHVKQPAPVAKKVTKGVAKEAAKEEVKETAKETLQVGYKEVEVVKPEPGDR